MNHEHTNPTPLNFSDEDFVPENAMPPGSISETRTFHQLGVFILDGSASMRGAARGGLTKAQAVNSAVRETLTRLKISRRVDNFSLAVVTHDTEAKVHTAPTPARDVDDNGDYDPLDGHGKATRIAAGMREALQLVDAHLNAEQQGGVPHSAIVIVMSDGEDHGPAQTLALVEPVKQRSDGNRVTFATVLFAGVGEDTGGAADHLRRVASDPVKHFKTVYDQETLRNFFISSISTSSGVAFGSHE